MINDELNKADCFVPCKEEETYFFNCAIISLKLANALSKFSAISSANTSGSGRLSKSASDLSFSQVAASSFCHFLLLDEKKVTKEKSRKERLHPVPFIVP